MNNYTTTIKYKDSNIEKVGCSIQARDINEAVKLITSLGGTVIHSSEACKCLVYSVN